MQNNTDTVTSPSLVREEMPERKSTHAVKAESRIALCVVEERQKVGLWRKTVRFFLRIFFSKTAGIKKPISPVTHIALAESGGALESAAAPASSPNTEIPANQNLARKLAEQQFLQMDTSRTTMN